MQGSATVLKTKQLIAAYQHVLRRRCWIIGGIALLTLMSLLLDISLGPAGLTPWQLWQTFTDSQSVSTIQRVILWDIRLPYSLMAIMVGLSLGLAGAEMQTILNNPLASPFTLGVSSAAAFGAALAIILEKSFLTIAGTTLVSINAFIFAIIAALLLDFVSRWSQVGQRGMVLFGIALVFSFNALVALLQFVATEDTLQGLVLWTMGNLARATWLGVGILTVLFIAMLCWSLSQSRALTTLRLGEERALSFGINTKQLRLTTLLRISLLSACSVAFVGPIGFIGLVAPHIARLLIGEDHRFYLPCSAVVGALVLSLASIASKNILHGVVIPVGIVTSLVGIPFFLTIIFRYRGNL